MTSCLSWSDGHRMRTGADKTTTVRILATFAPLTAYLYARRA